MTTPLPPTPPPAESSHENPAPPWWQFSLRELLAVMLLFSVNFGATYWLGPYIGALGGVGIVGFALWLRGRMTVGEILVICMLVLCLFGLLMPAVQSNCRPRGRVQCSTNLRQISLALMGYHDTFGSFPPAFLADSNGRPMHSWRVLILPQMGHKDVYDQYRFDEPWDGPHNRLLQSTVVPIFGCPGGKTVAATDTDYVVVVGPGTVFPADHCTSLSQLGDGPANTLLVVEVHHSGIHWMEPRDLDFAQMPATINSKKGQGIRSQHPGGALAAFVDGHVEFLPNDLPPEQLRARLTIAGGETVVRQ